MNFDFTSEQEELRAEFSRFLDAQDTLPTMRRLLSDPALAMDKELWTTLCTQGWVGASIPTEYGGLGLGPLELCVIAEELGRSLAPVPFGSTVYLFADAIQRHGSEGQRSKWLEAIARGEVIGCIATCEGSGDIVNAIQPLAQFSEGRITGAKWPVCDGAAATGALVLAVGPHGRQLYLVDLSENCRRMPLTSLDQSKGWARLEFDGAAAEPIGSLSDCAAILAAIRDRAAVLFAFEQLGGADRCLAMAVEFAKQRVAFGSPIGGFQAIRHKLADVYIANQLARSHAYYGAWALAADAPELPVAAAAAHLTATAAYWEASKENIQVHGGMGFTWESDCHLFYRRAEHLALQFGGRVGWRDRIFEALVDSPAE